MTQPVQEQTDPRSVGGLAWRTAQLARRPGPSGATVISWALLAIPDGQTVADDSLVVVTDYNRSGTVGTALSFNATTGLITINEKGIYDVHTWAEWDNQGSWQTIEGPVFQGGQDYQDIGNGLMMHPVYVGTVAATVQQHKTTFFVADLPQSVNLQVAHKRGVDDDLVNGGLTVVKIAPYP
jgi:hypothetical protein